MEKFVWLEKTDGLRRKIKIENGKMFEITNSGLRFIKNVDKRMRYTLDTELLGGKYYIFDNATVPTKTYIERMRSIKDIPSDFMVKEFYPVTSWKELIEFVENQYSPKTNLKIDGVILQRIDYPFWFRSNGSSGGTPFRDAVFKLKRRCMNTVDFYVKDSYLYTFPLHYPFSTLSRYNFVEVNEKRLQLFSSPFFPNLHLYSNRFNDTTGYFPDEIETINSLLQEDLEGKIVEFSLTNDNKWVPFRIRDDKQYPNGGRVAFSNVMNCFAPVTADARYFNKIVETEETIAYHEASHKVREIIATKFNNPDKVLDLCGGRGGDYRYFPHNISHLTIIDADRHAIAQYVDKIGNDKSDRKQATVDAIHAVLSTDNSEILSELSLRGTNKFDLILMNFAIHYLCDDEDKIIALSNMIKSILNPKGLFIISYHSGEELLRDSERSQSDSENHRVEIVEEKQNGAIIARVPLPTIDESGYREEPLALSKFLDLIDLNLVSETAPMLNSVMKNVRIKVFKL
jgi:SAM-dependent methyltransferase